MTELDRPEMTHDEMIDTLKRLVFGTFDRTTAREREALDEAIKVLENKLVVGNATDEDLISRKEIIKRIIPMYREGEACEYNRGHNDCWEQVIDKIKACLPDTHNIRYGKWIKDNELSSHCSECRQKILTCQNWFKYCPSCSAKMED